MLVERKPAIKPEPLPPASKHHHQGQFCPVASRQQYIHLPVDEIRKIRQHLADSLTKSVTGISYCSTLSGSATSSEGDVPEEHDQILQIRSEHHSTEHWHELSKVGTQFEGFGSAPSTDLQQMPKQCSLDQIPKWLECWSRKKEASRKGLKAGERDGVELIGSEVRGCVMSTSSDKFELPMVQGPQ